MKTPALLALIGVLAVTVLLLVFVKEKPTTNTNSTMTPTPSSIVPSKISESEHVTARKVVLKTTKGDIALNLFPDEAPLAVKNFSTLGKSGYYNGVIFHRVIKGFMNQAGDPTGTGSGGQSIYGDRFKTEINKREFVKGVLGVARTAQMDTNGSQFFIMAADTHSLDGQYTAMGQVADAASQQVVDAINSVPTNRSDKPLEDVKITGFEVLES